VHAATAAAIGCRSRHNAGPQQVGVEPEQSVAFVEAEIDEYLASRIRERDGKPVSPPSPAAGTGSAGSNRAHGAEIRGSCQRPQETGLSRNCVVADAFHRNRSPNPNSLITGNLTGNFLILGPFARFSLLIGEQIQMVTIKFPTRRNRGYYYRGAGSVF
jgi:hypothetical protein